MDDSIFNSVVDLATELKRDWAIVACPVNEGVEVCFLKITCCDCLQQVSTKKMAVVEKVAPLLVTKLLIGVGEIGAVLKRQKLPIFLDCPGMGLRLVDHNLKPVGATKSGVPGQAPLGGI